MGDRLASERDVCRPIEPITADIELYLVPIGSVLEVDAGLRGKH
jgi:hypothetical protein